MAAWGVFFDFNICSYFNRSTVWPDKPIKMSLEATGTSSMELSFHLPTDLGHFHPGVVPHIRYRTGFDVEYYDAILTAQGSLKALEELKSIRNGERLTRFWEDDPRMGWVTVDTEGVLLKDEIGFKDNLTYILRDLLANAEYTVEVRLRSKDVS